MKIIYLFIKVKIRKGIGNFTFLIIFFELHSFNFAEISYILSFSMNEMFSSIYDLKCAYYLYKNIRFFYIYLYIDLSTAYYPSLVSYEQFNKSYSVFFRKGF